MKKLVLSLTMLFSLYAAFVVGYNMQSRAIGDAIAVTDGPSIDTTELLRLTNDYRLENGLEPLEDDHRLNASAQSKCQHMVRNEYWSHIAPDGTEPWEFITAHYGSYQLAGENLARKFTSSSIIVGSWKQSKGHNKNLLDPGYTDVGFGYCDKGGLDIVVQHFAS